MTRFHSHSKGILYILSACLLWSTAGGVIKYLELPAPTIIFYRSLFAGPFLLLFPLLTKQVSQISLPRTKLDFFIIACAAGGILFFVSANKLTTSTNAIFLQFISVPLIFLLSRILFKDPLPKRNIVSFVGCLLGFPLFFIGNLTASNTLGNLLAIGAGISLTGYGLAVSKGNSNNFFSLAAIGFTLAGLLVIPMIPSFSITLQQFVVLGLLGIFQVGLAGFFYIKGTRLVTAQEMALYGLLEPVLNPIWAILLVGEFPSQWAIVGAGIILASLAYKALGREKQQKIYSLPD